MHARYNAGGIPVFRVHEYDCVLKATEHRYQVVFYDGFSLAARRRRRRKERERDDEK